MDRRELLHWLRCDDALELSELWQRADRTREEWVGDAVHLRGLVEISNHCARSCHYCGLRAANRTVRRYRLTEEDIYRCALQAVQMGYGTLVLQSGEDYGVEGHWLAGLIRRIKAATPLALTLSLGERTENELAAWREAGADRYLLRFETSDRALYQVIHPDHGGTVSDRIAILRRLRALGYETGGGVMVGIPGQSYESLADDILLFRDLDLDMIGIGPFIAHPETPLWRARSPLPTDNQVPPTVEMTCKVVALARILRPDAHIPATTAVAVMHAGLGRELALRRGANVIMPNLTPPQYREMYAIYPGKADRIEVAEACDRQIRSQIASLGRFVGSGQGGRRRRPAAPSREHPATLKIAVCMGSSCYSRGNNGPAIETMRQCVEAAGLIPDISGHLCENQCTRGPHVTIGTTLYSNVQASCFDELLRHHLAVLREEPHG
ncbi:[FeFe] hydrogenase H-cluster radical SAM maturase HydE [Desulfobulbus elongatus]|uniref:[FeFe] hydrogenase H-cluster radical SAM maturase HydE n=1 Tax=Desulfobulbus elongatus TaxID=53332 RepID=UPI00054FB87A|nr:[FeFe] hydrogenase H-cluster radical SAM maturase HydE [Desulfobulbus elongatus]